MSVVFINSNKRSNGYIENFVVDFDRLLKVKKIYVENAQVPNTNYLFHAGNNKLSFAHKLSYERVTIILKPDNYTGNELASELNIRINEQSFDNKFKKIYDGEWTYNNDKFEFSDIPEIIIDGSEENDGFGNSVINRYVLPGGEIISPLASLISFKDTYQSVSEIIQGTGGIEIPSVAELKYKDANNPGYQKFISSYESYPPFVVEKANNLFHFSENKNDTYIINLTGKTGFEIASSWTTIMSGPSIENNTYSGFIIRFNSIDDSFSIINEQRGFKISDNLIFTRDYQGNNAYYSPAVIFTDINYVISLNVNDTLSIDEGTGNINIVVPPGVYTLGSLAPVLQTSMDNSGLVNTYNVVFSKRTGKFIFKVIGIITPDSPEFDINDEIIIDDTVPVTTYAIYTIVHVGDIKDISTILGFTSSSSNLPIHKSDTRQYNVMDINITVSLNIAAGYTMTPGFYSIDDIVTEIQNGIPTIDQIVNSYIFVYNKKIKKFSLTNDSGSYTLYNNTESYTSGCNEVLGYINLQTVSPIISDKIFILDYEYLYIKSNIISRNVYKHTSIDDSYKNIIHRIEKKNIKDIVTFSHRSIKKFLLIENTSLKKLDFRIENENGYAINLNGTDWSFNIIFEI